MLPFLPLGATGAITRAVLSQDDAVSLPITINGDLPYSSGLVNTAYVSIIIFIHRRLYYSSLYFVYQDNAHDTA